MKQMTRDLRLIAFVMPPPPSVWVLSDDVHLTSVCRINRALVENRQA